MRSKMPKAEKFTDWVVEEVLPSIRKTGQYSMNDEEETRLSESNTRVFDMIHQLKQKDQQLVQAYDHLREKDQQLMQSHKTLKKCCRNFSPPTKNPDKNNTFVILDKKNPGEKYQYFAVRIQEGSL